MKTRARDYSKAFMITAAEAAKALLELKKVCVPQKPERPVRAVKKINYSE